MGTEELPEDLCSSYKAAMTAITELTDRIYAQAKLLELAGELDGESAMIDQQAIGKIGQLIATDSCRINSILDDFMPSQAISPD